MNHEVKIIGSGILACWNKDGTLSWKIPFKNGITNIGLDYLGGSGFSGTSQITAWYAGLIDLTSFGSLDVRDIMSSHTGWTENQAYSGNRPQWVNTESNQIVSSNGSFAFNITGSGVIHGLFITSSPTKGGTSGTLWSTAVLPSDATIGAGQTVTGTYQITLAGG